jgi:hypothetical protein
MNNLVWVVGHSNVRYRSLEGKGTNQFKIKISFVVYEKKSL